jgi:hypothetical protein
MGHPFTTTFLTSSPRVGTQKVLGKTLRETTNWHRMNGGKRNKARNRRMTEGRNEERIERKTRLPWARLIAKRIGVLRATP